MSDFDHQELEALQHETRLLAERVSRLESIVGLPLAATVSQGESQTVTAVAIETANAIPILGKALLALAGAYLLRALTEGGAIPATVGVGVGIAYSALWLALAARYSASDRMTAVVYGLTSVLVLSPLLWEAVIRFNAIGTWAAAGTLIAFTLLGLAISWQGSFDHIAWIATLAGVLTAAALLMATHDVVPFTTVFAVVAAAVEGSACFEHWLKERFLVATLFDMAVILMTWLATRANGLPEGYAPISPVALILLQTSLLAIYVASAMVRTLWRRLAFTNLEVFQCVLAFVIGVGGGIVAGHGAKAIAVGFASFTLLCGAASYLVSFTFLERGGEHGRNFYIYSSLGLATTIAAGGILLTGSTLGAVLPAAAIACLWVGTRYQRTTLLWHGVLYIVLADLLSGALLNGASLLLGQGRGIDTISGAAWGVAAGTLVCCGLAGRYRLPQVMVLAVTVPCAVVFAGFAAGALTGIPHADPGYCSSLRTAVLLGTSICLAWSAARWDQPAYSKAVYVLMLAGGYKLFVQELREERTAALVLSLFLYGSVLLLLPRLIRMKEKQA